MTDGRPLSYQAPGPRLANVKASKLLQRLSWMLSTKLVPARCRCREDTSPPFLDPKELPDCRSCPLPRLFRQLTGLFDSPNLSSGP